MSPPPLDTTGDTNSRDTTTQLVLSGVMDRNREPQPANPVGIACL